MKKNFKSIKATMIMGLLLISVFIAITPNSSAGIIINFSSTVYLNWENRSGEPVIPIQEIKPYKLNLEYTVTGSPFGRMLLYPLLYEDRRIDIQLSIEDYPDWAIVDLPQKTIAANIPSIGESQQYKLDISISLKEDAPAYEQGIIYIKVNVPTNGFINGFDQVISLPFKPAYRPLIDANPQINSKRIGPMDTATFAIDVSNLGNGRTKCFFEVDYDSLPDDWSALVEDTVILETGEGTKETVFLTVYPPKGFGYHDDIANIRVEVTPTWAEDSNIRGKPEPITVTVESRGLSFIGIEVILPIIILIVLVIIVLYLIFIKKMFIK
jgi:hypothetical protein